MGLLYLYPLNRQADGFQGRSGHFGDGTNSCLPNHNLVTVRNALSWLALFRRKYYL